MFERSNMNWLIPITVIIVIVLMLSPACKKDESGDKNKPFIIMNPPNPQYWPQDEAYIDPDAEAFDVTEQGDTINISSRLEYSNNIDVNVSGDYKAYYNVSDEAGNKADQKTRDVKVLITK